MTYDTEESTANQVFLCPNVQLLIGHDGQRCAVDASGLRSNSRMSLDNPSMRSTRGQRLRSVLNWINLTTPAGLAVARIGGARPRRTSGGMWVSEGYRPRFPIAHAFTIGNVVTTPRTVESLSDKLLAHETRHSTQYAVFGLVFLPLYGAAIAVSWVLSGDIGAYNVFERWAGLDDGGYRRRPLRHRR